MLHAPVRKQPAHFSSDNLDTGEALNHAHALAFAPFAFQAAVILRDRGILSMLDDAGDAGLTLSFIAGAVKLSDNAAHVLLEAGLGIGLLYQQEDRFFITRAGHVFRSNKTVRTNADFMRDVCLPGIAQLENSLAENRPAGLSALGNWETIFEGLCELPRTARDSWFAFNNHHSEAVFKDALPIIFKTNPKRILDIGGSTGRFALACLDQNNDVQVGIADIYIDAGHTEPGVQAAVRSGRIALHPMNILHAASLPEGYDTIWMSQFLPCFSEEQIAVILAKCHAVLPAGGRIYLAETFWDRQRYAAAAASLQMTSLYFVNIANGVSRLYQSRQVIDMLEAANFRVIAQHNHIGGVHTLMELHKI